MSVLRRATVMLIMFHLFSEIMFESFNIPGLYIAVQVRFIILFCSKLVLIPILQSFVFSIEKLITIMMMTILLLLLLLLLLLYFFYFRGWKTFPIKYTKKGIWGLKSCHIAINISYKSLYGYFHTNPVIFKTAHFFAQIGLSSTQNEWICSLKLHWFETALKSSLRPCS